MHKNIPVVDMKIDDVTHTIVKLKDAYDVRHLPPGINIYKTGIDRGALNEWLLGRSIPASRDGIRDALELLGVHSPRYLIEKCHALSLSDQYWIRPDSELEWSNINFFQNDFSKDIGEILFGHEPDDLTRVNLMSPDNTSDGWLKKRWIIADKKRLLMKGGSGVYRQEPFNEVIASAIMRRLNISHVDYTLTFDNDNPYSLCENFVTQDTELIPAWRILLTHKQSNNRSLYNHFFDCCEMLGVPDAKNSINKMLTLDYIIANEDRHWNNFGVLRNAETLEWIGIAPVFDSGTSLWYNTQNVGAVVKAKPFRREHEKQVRLVEDFSWFDFNALKGLDNEITEILSQSKDVDENRSKRISMTVVKRCGEIDRLSNEKPSIIDSLHENQFNVERPAPKTDTKSHNQERN